MSTVSLTSSRSRYTGDDTGSKRWFQILACLQDACGAPKTTWPSVSLKDILSSAIQSVQHDDQWNVSGVPELLVRAREMAECGCATALRMAVSLLDFYSMVEKYKGKVALGKRVYDDLDSVATATSGDATTSSPCDLPCKRRRAGDSDETCSNNSSNSSDGSEFAVPDLPCHRRPSQRAAPGAGHSSQTANSSGQSAYAPKQTATPSASPPACGPLWSGVLQHRHHGMVLDLAAVDVRLPNTPNAMAAQLPPSRTELLVSHLVPRATVKIGSHHTCRTSFQRATAEQRAKLQHLAEHELVAVAPLGAAGALVLVPYLDNAKALRGVSFLLTSAPALKR